MIGSVLTAGLVGGALFGGGAGTFSASTLSVQSSDPVAPVVMGVGATTFYNEAQRLFAARDVQGGLAQVERALALAPRDADPLTLQAVWADYAQDQQTSAAALDVLENLNGQRAATARTIIDGVRRAAQIVPSTQPASVQGRHGIVILGYGLKDDGTLAPELVRRLEAGRDQARTSSAPIVVSGGAPKRGITEAAAMRDWLVDNGVDASRITIEDTSANTVANAQNSAAILLNRGLTDVVLVTSPDHVRRAAASFAGAGLRVVGTTTTGTDIDKYQAIPTVPNQAGLRYEATRAARIPTTRQPDPGLDEGLPQQSPSDLLELGEALLNGLLNSGSAG